MNLIKTLTEGDEVTGFFLLKQLECKQTRSATPKDFFDIILADASGEISAKFWEVTTTDKETFFSMQLVKVKGVVQTYQEKLQFKIERIRIATEEDGVSITDFIRSAPIQAVGLVNTIKSAAQSIENESIKQIVEFCIDKVGDKLLHYPAAKSIHHAYYAGLAYHICRMLELGEFVCRQRSFLKPDLIKAGILLHDIAKPEEMIAEMGIVSDYSLPGKLLGHIPIASSWVTEAAIHLGISTGDERVIALQHLILSHHNLGEWGSPVQPQLPEAVALHYIDTLDAKLQAVEDALESLPESVEWTPNIRSIENKPIYRLKWKGEERRMAWHANMVMNGETRRTDPDADDITDGITFDKQGRMVLHPDFHPNHGTPVSLSERIYIVKYYESDGPRSIGFALGRTETSIMQLVSTMRKNGDWDLYQGLSDEEWTAILKTEK